MIIKIPFKKFVLLTGIIVLLTGCDPDRRVYTIKGNLYEKCNLVPMQGEGIHLRFKSLGGIIHGGEDFGIVLTDRKGAFEFKYKSPRKTGELNLTTSSGLSMYGIPKDENITIVLIRNELANLVVNLKADSVYSTNDTLIFFIQGHPPTDHFHKIAGPFSSEIIDTLDLNLVYFHGGFYYSYYFEGMKGMLWWGINSEANNKAKFTLTGCDVYDEVTIELN